MTVTQLDPDFLALQGALAGQYALERELGRGGMGIVYLAREVALDRLVALNESLGPLVPGTLAPVALHAMARLVRTRRLLADGFGLADIRRGLRQRLDERKEEVAYSAQRTGFRTRLVKGVAVVSGTGLVGSILTLASTAVGGNLKEVARVIGALSFFGFLVSTRALVTPV